MNRLRTIYYLTVLALFTIVIFVVFGCVWLLTVLFDRNRAVCHHVSRFWSKMIYRLCPWWRVEVSGQEHIVPGRPYVVVSNHQAMLDIPLLYVLPFNFKWVSKREVYKIPIFGWVLWMHGDVAIERGGTASTKAMFEKCEAYLDRGVSVVMFPEGTRTPDGQIGRFHKGAFTLAKALGVDILPICIHGLYDVLPKHDFMLRRGSVTLEICKRIPFDAIKDVPAREVTRRAHEWFVEHYAALRQRLETPAYWAPYVAYANKYKVSV